MVEKIRPNATIEFSHGMDGKDAHYYIAYRCPNCHKRIGEGDIACEECGSFFDWSMTARMVVKREVEWVPRGLYG